MEYTPTYGRIYWQKRERKRNLVEFFTFFYHLKHTTGPSINNCVAIVSSSILPRGALYFNAIHTILFTFDHDVNGDRWTMMTVKFVTRYNNWIISLSLHPLTAYVCRYGCICVNRIYSLNYGYTHIYMIYVFQFWNV